MLENQKLANLLLKFEDKIDFFIKDKSINRDIAKGVKELIQEKLNILNTSK